MLRRDFCVTLPALAVSTFSAGKVSAITITRPKGHPIAPDVVTTMQRTVLPKATPTVKIRADEVSKYKQYGYGGWQYGAPLKYEKRLDVVAANYTGASVSNEEKLLRFFAISDIHISDKESPSSAIYLGLKDGISPGYSGVMLDSLSSARTNSNHAWLRSR
jgi:hypothetical protein